MPALDGMKILGLTQWEAGTSCTQALAWLGAEVVKVERPGIGDLGRTLQHGFEGSDYFASWNCNSRSIAINLGSPEGRDLILEMIPKFDIVVENYALGVLEKLGLSYDDVKKVHPEVIYASIKGFGDYGPYAHYKCFDVVSQAAAGALSITGMPDGPPMRPGPTMGDSGSGVQLALAITAAYVQKMRTGKGQRISISMQEAMTYYMRTMVALGADSGRAVAPRYGNGAGALINLYPCTPFGPNDYVYVMALAPHMWETVCQVIDRPDLFADKRFADSTGRITHKEEIMEEVSKWTRQYTKHEAMKIFGDAGVPASAVLDTVDLFNDPHLNERGFIETVTREGRKDLRMFGWPTRMTESEVPITASPNLGEHTAEVLSEFLGLGEADIQALAAAGHVALEG